MAAVDATFNQLQLQLLDIYQKSMANGLEASLSMETKDGKHFLNFTMGDPTGVTVKTKGNWNPDSRRKKSPSQLKRDEKRRTDFLKNKNETNAKKHQRKTLKQELLLNIFWKKWLMKST